MNGAAMVSAALAEFPVQPGGHDGPVFAAPWEASAFAITVKLSEAGHFTWSEWVECLSAVIAEHEHGQDDHDRHEVHDGHRAADAGTEYYRLWFEALERMLARKEVLMESVLDERHRHLRDNPVPHDHVARREPVCIA